MFGWRKRSEGFEWEKYVRTTIKVRRADRRERAAGLVQALRDRLRGAFHHSVALTTAGAAAVGRGVRGSTSMAARLAAGVGAGLATRLRPAFAALDGTGSTGLLALSGGIALALFASRGWGASLDPVGIALLSAATLLLALALGAALASGRLARAARLLVAPSSSWWPRSASLPGLSRLPASARGLVVGGIVVAFGLGAAHWVGSGRVPGNGFLQFVTGALPSTAPTSTLQGRASAVTGDTLRVSDRSVRLAGIEAPDLAQRCTGKGGKSWRCGVAARDALAKLIAGKTVSCRVSGKPTAGRAAEGSCAVLDSRGAGADLGIALVRGGFVFAEDGRGTRYASELAQARASAHGLWQNRDEGERPSQWRQRLWQEAARKAPDGCPIKGRVSAAGKHYVLPWQAPYPKTRVQEKRGGRWFCSEEDARTAGFRPDLGT